MTPQSEDEEFWLDAVKDIKKRRQISLYPLLNHVKLYQKKKHIMP